MTTRRHRWGEAERHPLAHKTERECLNGCGIVKVTRHEAEGSRDHHWHEFWRNGERMFCDRTPACEPVTANGDVSA